MDGPRGGALQVDGQVAARWHCTVCNQLRARAGVRLWQGSEDREARHQQPCPRCGSPEVYGTGWRPVAATVQIAAVG